MSALVPSRHAETRIRQRGMRLSDPSFILRCGSEVSGDVHNIYFLKRKDVQREISRLQSEIRRLRNRQNSSSHISREHAIRYLKRQIHTLERLRGRKLVVAAGIVVTCYHSSRRDQKQMFRKGRERA